jgi:hypothetical protein
MWSWSNTDGSSVVPVSQVTVKTATAILMERQLSARHGLQLQFCQQARGLAAAVPSDENQLNELLPRLWKSPIRNAVKEPFWRLVVNALPTAQRRHSHGESCVCGAPFPGRPHHFWVCPVAAAVVRDIQRRQLDAFAVTANRPIQQLSALNIWLAKVPVGVLPWVWLMVCLAAIASMDHGRAAMAAQARAAIVPGSVIVQRAGNSSVARFWSLLEEAAVSRKLPVPCAGTVQPFFRFRSGWTVARV